MKGKNNCAEKAKSREKMNRKIAVLVAVFLVTVSMGAYGETEKKTPPKRQSAAIAELLPTKAENTEQKSAETINTEENSIDKENAVENGTSEANCKNKGKNAAQSLVPGKIIKNGPISISNIESQDQLLGLLEKMEVKGKGEVRWTMDQGTASFNYAASSTVEGVEEGDIVKSDGSFIYLAKGNMVMIVSTASTASMQVISSLDFTSDLFTPGELYVDGNHLLIIGSHRLKDGRVTTKAMIYDAENKGNIALKREFEIEGNTVATRKIQNTLYIVSQNPIDKSKVEKGENITPAYKDSAVNREFGEIPLNQVQYITDQIDSNYLTISAIDINDLGKNVEMYTCLGSAENVYVSKNNIYTAETRYKDAEIRSTEQKEEEIPVKTLLCKFTLKDGKVNFYSYESIPGTLLNTYSMDEYNNSFRVVATREATSKGDCVSKTSIYTFDEFMNLKGKLEDVVKGQQIASARFMENKLYIAAKDSIDSLYLIDLGNEEEPKVIKAMKVDGYENYLYPYDEEQILRIGKGSSEGSQLDQNPKALFFSRSKGLLAYPVRDKAADFQGVYVYEQDNGNGFKKLGQISHLPEGAGLKNTDPRDLVNNKINRILLIKGNFYTLSNSKLQVNNGTDLKEEGEANIGNSK